MKKKKLIKKIVKIVAVLLVIGLVIGLIFSGKKSAVSIYDEETVQIRDLVTYNKFTGNITPNENRNVASEVSAKVLEVLVEEGEDIKAGDVIALLDSSNLEYSIRIQEANLNLSNRQNVYNQRDAKKVYEDYLAGVESGQNAQLLGAKSSLTNSRMNLENARRNYEDAVTSLEDGSKLASAHTATIRANSDVGAAEKAYTDNEDNIAVIQAMLITATGGNAEDLRSQLNTCLGNRATLGASLSSARSIASNAYNSYISANTNLEDQIKNYKVALDNAQTSYDMAVENYDATVVSVTQTLENYKNSYEKTVGLSSNEASNIQLEQQKDQIEYYTLIAPIDGTISKVNIKEGEFITSGKEVANIINLEKMKISIKIDEYDLLGVSVGTPVDINVDAINVDTKGKIAKISKYATVNNGVSYFDADIEFDGSADIRSGMSVEVKLINREAKNVLTVSSKAVSYRDNNTPYVMVYGEDGVSTVEKEVEVGMTDGNFVEITGGLSEGDVVLVSNLPSIMQNMR